MSEKGLGETSGTKNDIKSDRKESRLDVSTAGSKKAADDPD